MSSESVARWNAIPMTRPDLEQDTRSLVKRARSHGGADDEDDGSEDNVSLVSRSPSPVPPPEAMDVDKYDEYLRNKAAAHEPVTVDTKIQSTNKGFLMLAKMGWTEGRPVGLSSDGRVDPVPFYIKNDLTGLGKASQDVRMIESTVAQRRELDSERMTKETEEQRRARENAVAKKAAVKSEIATTLRAFYCELCDKQFQNVAQYDEHTNSYAHHHKARFRDMQAAQRASRNTEDAVNQRKEKERKREEKELRKQAKAIGIKLAKPPVAPVVAPIVHAPPADAEIPGGFKKSGWATVSSSSLPVLESVVSATQSSGFKKDGWATVDSPGSSSRQERPTDAAVVPASVSESQREQPPPSRESSVAPAFRTGGWTSLDTGSSVPMPPSSPPNRSPPPPPTSIDLLRPPVNAPLPPSLPSAPLPTIGQPTMPQGPAAVANARSGWGPVSRSAEVGPPSGWQDNPRNGPITASVSQSPAVRTTSQKPQPPAARQENSRSGWQQFKSSGPGRRR